MIFFPRKVSIKEIIVRISAISKQIPPGHSVGSDITANMRDIGSSNKRQRLELDLENKCIFGSGNVKYMLHIKRFDWLFFCYD